MERQKRHVEGDAESMTGDVLPVGGTTRPGEERHVRQGAEGENK